MDRGAFWAIDCGVSKSWTPLSTHVHTGCCLVLADKIQVAVQISLRFPSDAHTEVGLLDCMVVLFYSF